MKWMKRKQEESNRKTYMTTNSSEWTIKNGWNEKSFAEKKENFLISSLWKCAAHDELMRHLK